MRGPEPVRLRRRSHRPGFILLSLEAAVDFGIDLLNHDPTRTWSQGYADN